MRLKYKLLISCILLASMGIQAQVTIGSNIESNAGALLDLKQQDPDGENITSKKGVMMPRVELTDVNKLIMSSVEIKDGDSGGDQYKKHIGLIVYHTDACTLSGKGLYVWTGTHWEPLNAYSSGGTTALSKSKIEFPSGLDKRGTVVPQTLTVNWSGAVAPTATKESSRSLPAVPGISAPASIGASPFDITLLADPVDPNEITEDDPWISKENILKFSGLNHACGGPDQVTINQTNYALRINDFIVYNSPGPANFNVKGNAVWTSQLYNPKKVLTGTTDPVIGDPGGEERDNGTAVEPKFEYTTLTSEKYFVAKVTFKDTAPIPRFDDIDVIIHDCVETNRPESTEEWAMNRIGFEPSDITGTNIDSPSKEINGYQLHRDQDGNLFISSLFGEYDKDSDEIGGAGRWMIQNLRATKYDAVRSDGTDPSDNPTIVAGNNYDQDYPNPRWGYPNAYEATTSTSRLFDLLPRIGLLYNWAAATRKYGGAKGTDPYDTLETGSSEASLMKKVQGICPRGWHLPSDWEWTKLEEEINKNTTKYAYYSYDINGEIRRNSPNNGVGVSDELAARGTKHGLAMIDPCLLKEAIPLSTNGRSFSPLAKGSDSNLGGFFVPLAGQATQTGAGKMITSGYSARAVFWTSSGMFEQGNSAMTRAFSFNNGGVMRRLEPRSFYYSVRCKKDYD